MRRKLVSKGKPKPRTFRGTCKVCNSTFDAEPEELKVEYDQREGESFAHATCPECKEHTRVGDLVMHPKFAS
jgi:RNase P subunit RPR2